MKSLDALMTEFIADHDAEAANRTPPPAEASIIEAAHKLASRGYLPRDREAFRTLATWLATDPKRRGLWLHGPAGTGKTMFAEANCGRIVPAATFVSAYRQEQNYNGAFWYVSCRFYDSVQDGPLVIDDLGQEPACVLYGQREEVLDRVISERYRAWQRNSLLLTTVTTNLSPAQLDARYGRRITDRLREMCVPVEFVGPSNRESAT